MKKQTLLSAVALTTIAVAGGANAGTLSAGTVGAATVKAPVVLANDFDIKGAALSGSTGLVLTPSAGAILPTGNALLTVNLVGGATFGTAVTAGAVVTNGACAPTTTVSSGGAAGDKTVTFLVSSLGGCTNAVPLHFVLPTKLDGTNTAVNFEAGLKTELGTPIDGGLASTYVSATKTNLIDFKNAISVAIAADTVPTYATLVSKFKSLTADKALGTVTVGVTAYAKGINDVTQVTAAGDITATKLTAKGDFSTIDIVASGPVTFAEATAGSGTATAAVAGGAAVHTIGAVEKGAAPVIKASTYTIAADLTAAGYKASALTVAATPIQSITREGASYLLPWVASGALATTSTSNSVVRLSNIGAADTGPVSIELLTSSKGVPASTALVPVAASIAKGGELVLTSASLQTTLGADFGRGDIRVTVEGQPSDLIVRRFVQSTVNGALSEVSLGRSATGAEPQN
ncbi:hypothetical protein [Brevundimonas sp.]|uniref:hypothetical protein n=1 Tax=Brevundimonas sp. TaxID=1871086 RepID=UPI002ED81370